jgi:hypothetical protein
VLILLLRSPRVPHVPHAVSGALCFCAPHCLLVTRLQHCCYKVAGIDASTEDAMSTALRCGAALLLHSDSNTHGLQHVQADSNGPPYGLLQGVCARLQENPTQEQTTQIKYDNI